MADFSKEFSLLNLSDEVLLNIFQYLTDLKDLITLRALNKRIAAIATETTLVEDIQCTGQYWLTTGMLETFIKPIAHKIKKLNLNSCYWIKVESLGSLRRCTNLRSLHLMQVKVEEAVLCDLLSKLPHLTSLSISVFNVAIFHIFVSECIGAQESLSRIRQLSIHFLQSNVNKTKNISTKFVIDSSFLDYFKHLNEIHIYGSAADARGVAVYDYLPKEADISVLTNLRVITLNVTNDINASQFFFNILHSLQKRVIKLNTLLQPSEEYTRYWSEHFYQEFMTDMESLVNLDISGTNISIPNHIINFDTACNLKYLNVSGIKKVDSESLQFLSKCCPQLVSVNLHNCLNIFTKRAQHNLGHDIAKRVEEDLTGLQSLIVGCLHLCHLNISGVHNHITGPTSPPFSSISALLSLKSKWQSLSISHCCLYVGQKCPKKDARSPELKQYNSTHLKCMMLPCSSDCTLAYFDLQKLISATPDMENFELYKPIHIPTYSSSSCITFQFRHTPIAQYLAVATVPDEVLAYIGAWRKLKTLQLIGIRGINLGALIEALAKGCVSLEKLSIACSGFCMAQTTTTFPPLIKLKDFRLENSSVLLDRNLLASLAQCPAIERVNITSYEKVFDAGAVKMLFFKAQRLFSFQLYSGASPESCQNLQRILLKKYCKTRPALSVLIRHLVKDPFQKTPTTGTLPELHNEDMIILRSRVATVPPNIA